MFSGYSVNKIAPLKYNLQIRETSIGEYLLYLFIITLNGNDNNMIFYKPVVLVFAPRGRCSNYVACVRSAANSSLILLIKINKTSS